MNYNAMQILRSNFIALKNRIKFRTIKMSIRKTISIRSALETLIILIPFFVYIIHISYFKNWIVDDAGISISFSRNLAYGYGLVPQAGQCPIECYSNFTWVLLLSTFFLIHNFDIVLTPKIVSAVLILATFVILFFILKKISKHYLLASIVILSLLAINTPFAIWTTSGMENPLYVFLIVLLLYQLQLLTENDKKVSLLVGTGLNCALIALTRPDGILYAAVFPVLLICQSIRNEKTFIRSLSKSLLIYLGSFFLIYGGYLLFRLNYFGYLFPNTYYAKGGPSFNDLINILLFKQVALQKVSMLTSSFANEYGNLALVILFVLWIGLIFQHKFEFKYLPIELIFVVSMLVFLLLPKDWMPEFRFATPFYIFLYILAFVVFEIWISYLIKNPRKKILFASILIVTSLLGSGAIFLPRTKNFANNPIVPMRDVARDFGERFNKYADKLGLKDASLLVPDVGGTLYTSKLKVFDLAGLCDSTIAHSIGKNQAVFFDYVFDTIKPTFIHTHYPWDGLARLDDDARFRRDYVPINEEWDEALQVFNGDYVRKDVLAGKSWDDYFK